MLLVSRAITAVEAKAPVTWTTEWEIGAFSIANDVAPNEWDIILVTLCSDPVDAIPLALKAIGIQDEV